MPETEDRPNFVHVSYIDAPPENVWAALTSPEFTRQYWGGRSIESDWQVGAPIRHLHPDGTLNWQGEILRCEPPQLLSYSWGAPPEPQSRIVFAIETAWGVTRLTVTHDRFAPDSRSRSLVEQGWPAILSNLKTLLETGRTLPFAWRG